MRYTRLMRNEIHLWIPIILLIEAKQPDTYRKLKALYPGISRIVADERDFNDIKRLMQEKQGVEI